MTDTTSNEPMPPLYRNRSPEIAKLAAALCKAQGAMEGAKKDAENPGFKRGNKVATYADLASVWDAIRKPLSDNGLAVIQFPRTVAQGVEIETTLMHSSGEFMSDVLWVPCGKFDAHGMGSAITYGRRYALMAVAGIAPVDDDGNAAVDSHKGVAGMASGGTDFRPERRQMPARENSMDAVAEEDRDLVQGDGQSKYLTDKRKQAENFLQTAMAAFSIVSGSEAVARWYDTPVSPKGRSKNRDAAERLKENFPDLGDKLETAADNARSRFP